MRTLNEIFTKNVDVMNDQEKWDHYRECLKRHDWSFEFSDDFTCWKNGSIERDHIRVVRDKLGEQAKEEYMRCLEK
jgi:hypothetical protein